MAKLTYAQIRNIQDEINTIGHRMAASYALTTYECLFASVMVDLPEAKQMELVGSLGYLKTRVEAIRDGK